MSNKTTGLTTGLSYKDAGVDIDAGNALVNNIKSVVKQTQRPEVLGGLGGFGGLFELPSGYRQPILVSGTDGVGTKLRLAIDLGRHDQVGIDLVAMCVNDLLVQGAEPLFFLDYYATGQLDVSVATDVVTGIATGCQSANCALIGGETAEMPGMYQHGDYDIAGFCVGIVEKEALIDGSKVKATDQLIALGSSGPHSNGYSLIRKVLADNTIDIQQQLEGKPLADHLLEPTKIYVKSILELLKSIDVHALSHITGGGFWENIPRVLPANCKAMIHADSWQWPVIFRWIQEQGQITEHEMYRTFNCGVGMILVVAEHQLATALDILRQQGEQAWHIGEIATANADESSVEII